MIRFTCPVCGHAIKTPNDAAGKTGKCKCGERVRVPSPPSSVLASPPAIPQRPPSIIEKIARDESASANPPAPVSSPPPSESLAEPSPLRLPSPPPPAPSPRYSTPTGEMILCYACRKQLADTALNCPKCGAVQTPEGREKGRQMKKREQTVSLIFSLVFALPFLSCCFMGMICNAPTQERVPAGWDMDKLKRDTDEVARDPSKTIFVPKDGSQPRVVPNSGFP